MYYVSLFNDILHMYLVVFFFKQKTAYEMRISDWSSDVCSSDLRMFILYSSVLKRWTPGSGPVARRQNRVGGPVDGGGAGAPTWGRALAGTPDRRVAASNTRGATATASSGSSGTAATAP